MSTKNNIFEYAQSEFAQDAFISWIVSWGNFPKEPLYGLACDFINYFIAGKSILVKKVVCLRQHMGIDVLIIVNDEIVILFENKLYTNVHSDQLKRYRDYIEKNADFEGKEKYYVFYKFGDQSNYKNIVSEGYSVFKRNEFIKILDRHKEAINKNTIANDFFEYINKKESEVMAFTSKCCKDWNDDQWQGFFMELQKGKACDGLDDNWGYVPNQTGGFLGFWWNWQSIKSSTQLYLQIEYWYKNDRGPKLCIKSQELGNCEGISPYELRNAISLLSSDMGFSKPDRFGAIKSATMTIAQIELNIANDWQSLMKQINDCEIQFNTIVGLLKEKYN